LAEKLSAAPTNLGLTDEPPASLTLEPKVEPKLEPKVEPKLEPKVEPKLEPKVEPKNEFKVTELDKADQDFLDYLDKDINTEPDKKDVKDLGNDEIKLKATEYEQLLADPFFKAFVDYRKNGGTDIATFAKNIIGEDVSKLSDVDLYKRDLQSIGDISPEDIDEEIESFNLKSKIEQKRITNPIREQLKKQQEEAVKNFSVAPNQNIEIRKQAAQVAAKELDTSVQALIGSKYNALYITPEMGENIKNFVNNQSATSKYDDKGNFVGFDIADSIETAIFKLYKKNLQKATYALGKTQGMAEVLKERQRPNDNNTSLSNTIPASQMSVKEAAKQIVADSRR
jgi:hypothetical protein